MSKNKLLGIICIFICIFVVPSIFAVPPQQQSGSISTGIEIEYPKYSYIKNGLYYNLHTHVFNKSNGIYLTNDTTDCYLHMYNHTGDHVLELQMYGDSNGFEFELDILAGNFTVNEQYAYIIFCNTSVANSVEGQGGFSSGGFIINDDGEPPETYNNYSFISIIVVFLFFAIVLIISLFITKAIWLKAVISMALAIIIMSLTRFLSWFVSITNPLEVNLIDTLDKFYMFSIQGLWFVFIAAIFILLIVILNTLKFNKKRKKDNWDDW